MNFYSFSYIYVCMCMCVYETRRCTQVGYNRVGTGTCNVSIIDELRGTQDNKKTKSESHPCKKKLMIGRDLPFSQHINTQSRDMMHNKKKRKRTKNMMLFLLEQVFGTKSDISISQFANQSKCIRGLGLTLHLNHVHTD